MGVTIEDNEHLGRVERLREVPSAVRFLSIEPLLGRLPALNLDGIDWVIVGGESGPAARPMHESWVLEIRDACLDGAVPFFFKQWGGTRKKAAGRELESRKWSECHAGRSVWPDRAPLSRGLPLTFGRLYSRYEDGDFNPE